MPTTTVLLTRLMKDVIGFCYPGVCAGCRGASGTEQFLCRECLDGLKKLETAPACQQCGMPVAQAGAPCPFCQDQGVPHYDRILRLGVFNDPLKGLIHQFKYNRRWNIGEQLADRLLAHEPVRQALSEADVLVPVPLHPWRRFHRGYNQAMVIAKWLSRGCGKPIGKPLARVRHTETQTHLHSRQKRFDNLRGAFRLIQPKAVAGKRVLVIDDVMTTGATVQTVARALRPAQPASLSVLVLAVADPKGRDFRAV